MGILWDAISADQFSAAERRAKIFGLQVHSLKLENPPYDFGAAFGSLAAASTQTLLVLSSPHFTPVRAQIAQLAILHRMPTMFIFKAYVEAGGPLSYGADFFAMQEVKDMTERARLWTLAVAAYPPYAEYQARTKRQIPLFVAEP